MGKKCDLCSGVARMYCESDEASLCWDCDGKVHGANFLVAKHTRCLLCTACQSLTPWKATGLRLLPTFSVCDSCVALKHSAARRNRVSSENPDQEEVNSFDSQEDRLRDDGAESYDDDDEDEDDDDDDDDDNEGDVDDDEETDNQVVPWSAAAQPPPVMSSSSSDGGFVMKRTRENSDLLCSDDEIGSSSAQGSNYSPPLKRSSRDEPPSKSTAVVNSVVRLSTADTSASSSYLTFAIDNTRRDLSR